MKFLAVLLVLVLIVALIYVAMSLATGKLAPARRRDRRWRVETTNRPDGTMVVQLRRAGEAPRDYKELPAGMDPVDFRLELDQALEEAERDAAVLNRRTGRSR